METKNKAISEIKESLDFYREIKDEIFKNLRIAITHDNKFNFQVVVYRNITDSCYHVKFWFRINNYDYNHEFPILSEKLESFRTSEEFIDFVRQSFFELVSDKLTAELFAKFAPLKKWK